MVKELELFVKDGYMVGGLGYIYWTGSAEEAEAWVRGELREAQRGEVQLMY